MVGSWLTFQLDLRQADYRLWLMLGEAQAKCLQIANSPLLPAVAEELNQIYLAKGVMATTAIEGNTLTEEEVQKRLRGQLKLPPSKEYLGQEIDNIQQACRMITDKIFVQQSTRLTVDSICAYNRMVISAIRCLLSTMRYRAFSMV